MGQATDTDISATTPEEAFKPSLLKAFSVFEQQCQLLEESHKQLKAQLDQANLELEKKNAELGNRLVEIEGMKERLSGILESITDAVIHFDVEGQIAETNAAAVELLDHHPKLLQHPELQELLESNELHRDHDIAFEDRHIFMVTVVPMAEGRQGRLLVLKDVTEYRELLNRVEREDRLSALGHVAANVAHEIRNPLQALEGFVQLLKRDIKQDDEVACRQIDRIMQAAQQLNGVVGNLLSYTREMRISTHRSDLRNVVRDVVEMTLSRARTCKVDLQIANAKRTHADIDGVQIKQVVSNLVVNAIEACEHLKGDGCIEVSCGEDNGFAMVQVKDNGSGMTEEVRQRVFEPFFTSKSGGIGLGLALCRRIVDAHGGRIVLTSEPAAGTTFQLLFPKSIGDGK